MLLVDRKGVRRQGNAANMAHRLETAPEAGARCPCDLSFVSCGSLRAAPVATRGGEWNQ